MQKIYALSYVAAIVAIAQTEIALPCYDGSRDGGNE